jgi:broad specificity phosphatase PhoE
MASKPSQAGRSAQEHEVDLVSESSGHTTVHLLRHGEVYNPEGVLYGRLPGYFLSDLGLEMADRAATALAQRDIAAVISSPMERAQQTATPIAISHKLDIVTDQNLIEAENIFEGQRVSVGDGVLKQPKTWRHLWNPFKPSWGEPYEIVAARMNAAIESARLAAQGREAVLVSHQLPIWVARLSAERRRLWHDPRSRQCTLASLTSLTFDNQDLVAITYSEPSRDLLEKASKIAGA